MSKTLLALLLVLSVPTIYAQGTGKQTEYSNPPSTKGSDKSRAEVKAEERASGSLGTKQGEYADPGKRVKGSTAANDGSPASDPFANRRNEKSQAKSAYNQEKSKDRADYREAKKDSTEKLKATKQRSESEKNLEVPK